MALPPVGVQLVAKDAGVFDAALKTAGSTLDGFGKTASAVTASVNSVMGGMASAAGKVLAPIGALFDRIFTSVIRTVVNDAIRQIERFISATAEAAIKGTHLENSLNRLSVSLQNVARSGFAPFVERLGEMVDSAAPAFLGIVQAAEEYLGGLGQSALTWGENFVNQFAQGMWNAVGAILSVLTDIASMITYWLSPGSPPRLLPDIDKWGTSAANEFFGGWAKADFGIFNEFGSTITNLIRSIPIPKGDQAGVIPNILGARQGIAAAVEELRTTGSITVETMNAITAAVGTSDASVRAYLESMVRLQAASDTVKAAQAELNAVTEKYNELLKPIDAELAGISEEQQQLADEQKKSLLQLVLKDPGSTLAQKRQAQLEIERIDAEKRRRALLAEQKTAVEGAKDKLDAAKEAEQRAQEEFDARKALILAQTEQNNLLKEQIRLLESLNKIGGGGPKPAGGGKVGGPSPFDIKPFDFEDFVPPDILEKWDAFVTSFGTLWDKIKEKFKPTIDAINNDLIPAFDNLIRAIQEKMPKIKDEVSKTFAFMIEQSAKISEPMVQNIADAVDAMAETWRTHGDTFIEATGFTFRSIFTLAILMINDIIAGLTLGFIALGTVFDVGSLLIQGEWTEAWERLKTGASDAWDVMKRTAESNLTALFDLFGLKWDEIKTQLVEKWDGIGDAWAEWLQKTSDALNTKLNEWSANIINGPTKAFNDLLAAARAVWEFITGHTFTAPGSGGQPGSTPPGGVNGLVNGPSMAGIGGGITNNSSVTTGGYTYAPTYISTAPPPSQGFATMAALYG